MTDRNLGDEFAAYTAAAEARAREQRERAESNQDEANDFYDRLFGGRLNEYLRSPRRKREPKDVGGAMRHGVEPPAMLIDGWLIEGEFHWWSSDPEAGKTWGAIWLSNLVMEKGLDVIYFDEELDVAVIAERFAALGADPDVVDEHFYYLPFPSWGMEDADVDEHRELLEALRPALVVYDTATDMLSAAKLDENSGGDVTRWVKAFAEEGRKVGSAVLVPDHVGHGDKSRAVGSRAKRAKAKAEFGLKAVKRFDSTHVGEIEVRLLKNTRGAELPLLRRFAVGGTPFQWELLPDVAPTGKSTDRKSEALARAGDRVLKVLHESGITSDEPIGRTDLKNAAGGHGETTLAAIDKLTELDFIGHGLNDKKNTVYWHLDVEV